MNVKIVKYGDRISPVYEEVGELETINVTIGWNGDEEYVAIDISDIMDFINRR